MSFHSCARVDISKDKSRLFVACVLRKETTFCHDDMYTIRVLQIVHGSTIHDDSSLSRSFTFFANKRREAFNTYDGTIQKAAARSVLTEDALKHKISIMGKSLSMVEDAGGGDNNKRLKLFYDHHTTISFIFNYPEMISNTAMKSECVCAKAFLC